MTLPMVLAGIHFFCQSACPSEPIPVGRTVCQFLHLVCLLLLVSLYFSWHQQELRRYSGAEGVELGLDQATASVDRVVEADAAAIRKDLAKNEADTRDTITDSKS